MSEVSIALGYTRVSNEALRDSLKYKIEEDDHD
jgi:hypothetical protein